MAYDEFLACDYCGRLTWHTNGTCTECRDERYVKERDAWHERSLREKLDDILNRLEELEAGPPIL